MVRSLYCLATVIGLFKKIKNKNLQLDDTSVKMGQTAKNNITQKPLPPINAVQDFISHLLLSQNNVCKPQPSAVTFT